MDGGLHTAINVVGYDWLFEEEGNEVREAEKLLVVVENRAARLRNLVCWIRGARTKAWLRA